MEAQIQHSKLNKIAGTRLNLFSIRVAACGAHARSGPAGRELRASARRRLRPARSWRTGTAAAGCCGFAEAAMQNEELKIKNGESGRSLRKVARANLQGAPPGRGCGPHGPGGPEQRLRAAAASLKPQCKKIKNSESGRSLRKVARTNL